MTTLFAVALAPTAAADAQDPECAVILPAADDLEAALRLLSLGADAPPNAGTRIQSAVSPLNGLTSAAAIDLRLRASTVADHLNGTNPYHTAPLATDLEKLGRQLGASRDYCSP